MASFLPAKRILQCDVPKASTGTTYSHLADLVKAALQDDAKPKLSTSVVYNSQLQRIKELTDALFNGVRLEAWSVTTVNSPAAVAYQLPVESCSVVVTDFTAELWKGMRRYPVADGPQARALFEALKHAQDVIQVLATPVDIPDEEFFTEPDPEAEAAIMDIMLQGPEDRTQSVRKNAAAHDEAKPFIEDELPGVPIGQAEYDRLHKRGKAKYDPSKEDKKAPYAMEEDRVQRHLKSLQGRVLTIVEAAISEKSQREAIKTLVNKEFRREMEKVAYRFMNPTCDQTDGE